VESRRAASLNFDVPEISALATYVVQNGGNWHMIAGWSTVRYKRRNGAQAGNTYCEFTAPADEHGKVARFRSKAEVARYLGLTPSARSYRKQPKPLPAATQSVADVVSGSKSEQLQCGTVEEPLVISNSEDAEEPTWRGTAMPPSN